jgi:hypothetical protein
MMTGIVSGRVLWSSTPLTHFFAQKKKGSRHSNLFLSYIRRLTTAAVAALK